MILTVMMFGVYAIFSHLSQTNQRLKWAEALYLMLCITCVVMKALDEYLIPKE